MALVFDLVDPAAVILDFEGRAVDLPVDDDHQPGDKATRTGPTPVAGPDQGTEGRCHQAPLRPLGPRPVDRHGGGPDPGRRPVALCRRPSSSIPRPERVSGCPARGLSTSRTFPSKPLHTRKTRVATDDQPAHTAATGPLMACLVPAMGLPADTPADTPGEEVAGRVEKRVAALERLTAKPMPATAAELVHARPDPARLMSRPLRSKRDPASATQNRPKRRRGGRREKLRAALQGGSIIPAMRDRARGPVHCRRSQLRYFPGPGPARQCASGEADACRRHPVLAGHRA